MEIRAIEFFSGIGGLHHGLTHARPSATVAAAFDVNVVANSVYAHNFPSTPVLPAAIDHLTPATIARWRANTWLLSPPCQPFTRGGKALDHLDDRSRGLLHLIGLLPRLDTPPQFLFLENVKGFETSRCRHLLVRQLRALQYEVVECLVEPTAVGVPNTRLRYFLLARRRRDTPVEATPDAADLNASGETEPLDLQTSWPVTWSSTSSSSPLPVTPVRPLSDFLDADENPASVVPEQWIRKSHKFNFDLVTPNAQRSSTFTKSYGSKHIFGSGSFIVSSLPDAGDDSAMHDNVGTILSLKPRFFTPSEVARLHSFPPTLSFPEDVSRDQQYRLLGNSLNVLVVGELLKVLFAAVSESETGSD
ncbi:S-adenosyl-L-methionine-dependent methyltransferase [Blastocladiella britannica]|nr:S-adenosyl-L-methionine-dependent methyltransferase [Blastocladiella britannica]